MQATITTTKTQDIFRILLGLLLLFTGIGHLTFVREDFAAQVPSWVPLGIDTVVVLSGIVELTLGFSLVALGRYKVWVGWVTTTFFIAIFPGNYTQYINHTGAFGLNTDNLRLIRLFLHPLLIIWPLWSTGAWKAAFGKRGQ